MGSTNWCLVPLHLRKEKDRVSETLFFLVFLEYRTKDKAQNPVIPSMAIINPVVISKWI